MPDITIQSEFAPRVDSNRSTEKLYTPRPPGKGGICEINQNLLIFIFTQKLAAETIKAWRCGCSDVRFVEGFGRFCPETIKSVNQDLGDDVSAASGGSLAGPAAIRQPSIAQTSAVLTAIKTFHFASQICHARRGGTSRAIATKLQPPVRIVLGYSPIHPSLCR